MAGKKKTSGELRAENRMLRRYAATEGLVSVANNLIRWGGVVWITYFIYLMVAALAGKATLADIGIKFLSDVRVSEALAWALGGGGTVYGWRQRKLRRDTVVRLQTRIQKLEKQRDPRRTSSRLTERGETRPEDEV